MDRLASQTWDKVARGDKWGLKFREDSLTDHNLFELATLHPALVVDKHNGYREKRSGADWEWWVGSVATGWVALRVQAKRLHGFGFDYLDHAGALPGERQYDTLIRECASLPAHYPLHVFYSGWHTPAGHNQWPSDAVWHACPRSEGPGSCVHADVDHYGCSVASSGAVAALASSGSPKAKYAPEHLSQALPWSYLFRVPTYVALGGTLGTPGDEQWPAEWTDAYWSSRAGAWMDAFQSTLADFGAARFDPPGANGAGGSSLPRVRVLPPHVQRLLASRGTGEPPDGDADPDSLVPQARMTLVLDVG